jgi:hypothetical protein
MATTRNLSNYKAVPGRDQSLWSQDQEINQLEAESSRLKADDTEQSEPQISLVQSTLYF